MSLLSSIKTAVGQITHELMNINSLFFNEKGIKVRKKRVKKQSDQKAE